MLTLFGKLVIIAAKSYDFLLEVYMVFSRHTVGLKTCTKNLIACAVSVAGCAYLFVVFTGIDADYLFTENQLTVRIGFQSKCNHFLCGTPVIDYAGYGHPNTGDAFAVGFVLPDLFRPDFFDSLNAILQAGFKDFI